MSSLIVDLLYRQRSFKKDLVRQKSRQNGVSMVWCASFVRVCDMEKFGTPGLEHHIGCFGWLLFEKQMKEPLSHLAQLQVLIPKRTSCIQLQHRHDGFHTAVIPDKKLRWKLRHFNSYPKVSRVYLIFWEVRTVVYTLTLHYNCGLEL